MINPNERTDNRQILRNISSETLQILLDGFYFSPGTKEKIDLRESLENCITQSILYGPHDFSRALLVPDNLEYETQFFFLPQTTLGATQMLVEEDPSVDVVVLNFASAKNPGGGFLKGSQAQEESIARSSGIYQSLNHPRMYDFYETNRNDKTCLYSHNIIYSPKVPVIRNDDLTLLDRPYFCSFITSPSVNAGHALERVGASKVATTIRERIDRILGVAVENSHHVIVLGAWGCGVFRNEASDIAMEFRNFLLGPDAKYGRAFTKVIFAIPEEDKCLEFEKIFSGQNPKPKPQQQSQQQRGNNERLSPRGNNPKPTYQQQRGNNERLSPRGNNPKPTYQQHQKKKFKNEKQAINRKDAHVNKERYKKDDDEF